MAGEIVVNPKRGRYVISPIITELRNGTPNWNTEAGRDGVAEVVENYYPMVTKGGRPEDQYQLPYALCILRGEVFKQLGNSIDLFPNLDLSTECGSERDAVRNVCSLIGQSYTGFYKGDNYNIISMDVSKISTTSTFEYVLKEIFSHLYHSSWRNLPSILESHNTEVFDNFDTDTTATDWTNDGGSGMTWNSGTQDVTFSAGTPSVRYTNQSPGSIEHESQGTILTDPQNNNGWSGPVGVRMQATGAENYHIQPEPRGGGNGAQYLQSSGDGTLATWTDQDLDTSTFITIRLSAEGAEGANVDLSHWFAQHTASKPADPGWLTGQNPSTADHTFQHTAGTRYDAAANSDVGCSGSPPGDYNEQFDFWKGQATTDRTVAAGGVVQHPLTPYRHNLTR